MFHQLYKQDKRWHCSICNWIWTSKPQSNCPSLPRYSWEGKPQDLLSKTQLGKQGLKLVPNQQVRGVVQSGDGKTWWKLYDKFESVPKQKKSPPSKSTRVPCPIGLDCLLVAAERGKPCPNKDYCAVLARPWDLPFITKKLLDGTPYLFVCITGSSGTERQEKRKCGWEEALALPYQYVKGAFGEPVLLVTCSRIHQCEKWSRPEPLPESYWMWVAVHLGMPYQEFRNGDWYEFARNAMDFDNLYFDEDLLPSYPHCFLPPKE